jgi:hypothetical protein
VTCMARFDSAGQLGADKARNGRKRRVVERKTALLTALYPKELRGLTTVASTLGLSKADVTSIRAVQTAAVMRQGEIDNGRARADSADGESPVSGPASKCGSRQHGAGSGGHRTESGLQP